MVVMVGPAGKLFAIQRLSPFLLVYLLPCLPLLLPQEAMCADLPHSLSHLAPTNKQR